MIANGTTNEVGRVASRVSEASGIERRTAFERFTQDRLERAYRLAGVLLRDADEAQDAVHDAAVQAWLHWADLRDPDRLDAWFDRILVNECRARLRRRRVRPIVLADPLQPASADPSVRLAEGTVLDAALAALDTDHRIAVVLRYAADLGPAQIAARTGEREGTIKSRLHYALRELRAALDAAERETGGSR